MHSHSAPAKNRSRLSQMPSELVGVAGFEPAASSSRTKRAAKLRYTPPARNLRCRARLRQSSGNYDPLGHGWAGAGRAGPGESAADYPESRGIRVSRLASGRQANRAGAQGDVPSPAETCSQAWPSTGCL